MINQDLIVSNKFELRYIYDWTAVNDRKVSFSINGGRKFPTQEKDKNVKDNHLRTR